MAVGTVVKGHSVMSDTYIFGHEETSGEKTGSVEKCRFSPPRTTRASLPTPTEHQSWASQPTRERKASRSANPGLAHIRRKLRSQKDEGMNHKNFQN